MMTGKWHLGPFDRDDWPRQRGFARFYGCIDGAMRFFQPHGTRIITMDNEPVPEPESTTDRAFYVTDAFTDYAIQFLKEEKAGADRPSFLYLAYNAPHWPLQAHEEDIAKYRGRYRMGWDKLREQRYARQIELGLIRPEWPLSPRTEGIPDWDSLDAEKQDEMDLKMAVYAAMVDCVDQNIGRLIAYLKESGRYDNTLILFLSDNGACQEGSMFGRGEFYDVEKRNLEDANSYGEAWANAGNTPFRLYKHFAHEGGAATPFFMHWPRAIVPVEAWYDSPAQLIDILPTLMDVGGAEYPGEVSGTAILPFDGISLRPAFRGEVLVREQPIFIEHETHAFVRDGDWKLVGERVSTVEGTDARQWELYDMVRDRVEINNLAEQEPERVRKMAAQWEAWAARVGVYPRPPEARGGGGGAGVNPQVKGRPFRVVATVRGPKPEGVALSQGGNAFGYSLYFVEGRPAFAVRDKKQLTLLLGPDAVNGKVTVEAEVGAERYVLRVDGVEVASAESPGLMSGQPQIPLSRGEDLVDAVGEYAVPNKLKGRLIKAEVMVD